MNDSKESFGRLLEVMDRLRAECPWDREQTIHSLRNNTIEETYELADAIADNDWDAIRQELGDLLLHVVFYAKIASEQGRFSVGEVIDGLCEKLIFRHPHVFGEVAVNDSDDVSRNWEALKLKEKSRSGGVLGGVPRSLPAMVKAYRISQKAAASGFDWQRREDVWDKVREEIDETTEEMLSMADAARLTADENAKAGETARESAKSAASESAITTPITAGENAKTMSNSVGENKKAGEGARERAKEQSEVAACESTQEQSEVAVGDDRKERLEGEFGDLFFSLVNAARLYGVDPEMALERTNRKFISRFNHIEARAAELGKPLRDFAPGQLEEWWQEAKYKQ